ncbi:helix-turn-helix transcriptional regulator [Bacillus alkalicellulosilyticus]|uniref:helix-turn-helix transcriptional regulator n=1 Tax=Alkalihalobacterium alkalicellulosilyticum TaxID=1912214 RepID=UPI0009980379|nr:helix-turn-helix transcriptional regulator [Bacillus alkalicellulosilyticus]
MKEKSITQHDFHKIFLLYELMENDYSGGQLLDKMNVKFPYKVNVPQYIYKALRSLKNEHEIAVAYVENKVHYFTITSKGKDRYYQYKKELVPKFKNMKQVIDCLVYTVTGGSYTSQRPEPPKALSKEDQRFFSSHLNVKDIIAYEILARGTNTPFITAHLLEDIESKYGWSSSKTWMYDVIHHFEENGYLVGKWDDPVLRTLRYYRVTDEGVSMFQSFSHQVRENVLHCQHFFSQVLDLLDSSKGDK